MLKLINKIFNCILFGALFLQGTPVFAVLSCSITTAVLCSDTVVLRMSSQDNAHAEIPSLGTPGYSNNVVCCSGAISPSKKSKYF